MLSSSSLEIDGIDGHELELAGDKGLNDRAGIEDIELELSDRELSRLTAFSLDRIGSPASPSSLCATLATSAHVAGLAGVAGVAISTPPRRPRSRLDGTNRCRPCSIWLDVLARRPRLAGVAVEPLRHARSIGAGGRRRRRRLNRPAHGIAGVIDPARWRPDSITPSSISLDWPALARLCQRSPPALPATSVVTSRASAWSAPAEDGRHGPCNARARSRQPATGLHRHRCRAHSRWIGRRSLACANGRHRRCRRRPLSHPVQAHGPRLPKTAVTVHAMHGRAHGNRQRASIVIDAGPTLAGAVIDDCDGRWKPKTKNQEPA